MEELKKIPKNLEKLMQDENADVENPQNKAKKKDIPCCACMRIRYYQQYFQVTNGEVLSRVFWSIIFIFNKFNDVAPTKTDLYGPFWIYCTIVFSLAISQNVYSFLSKPKDAHFVYTISYVPSAFAIVYCFGLMIPVIFNFILRITGSTMRYSKMIQIYGYSQTINIFMMFCCAWPNSAAQTFFILYGAIHSSLFIFLCAKSELGTDSGASRFKYGVVVVMCICQFVLVMTYKFYFFGTLYTGNEKSTEIIF